MQTCRADTPRRESVPRRAASAIEIFGMIYVPAHPRVHPPRSPLTQRATNARDLDVVTFINMELGEVLGFVPEPHSTVL